MHFQLTDEQALLRDTTRDVLRGYDVETRNAAVDTDPGFRREVWGQLAEIGLLGLAFDETDAGAVEVAVIAGELGRRLALEPFIHAALAPGVVIAERGDDAQRAVLDAVAAGETLLALAHREPGDRGIAPAGGRRTRATSRDGRWTLTGVKNPVLVGDSADVLVVSAALPDDAGTGVFLVDGADAPRRAYRTFDGRRAAQLDLDDTPAVPLGAPVDATATLVGAAVRTASALCSEAVGMMDEALRLTTDYLRARKQFGVPLRNFQTLTQRAADVYVSVEQARSMSLYLALSVADGRLDPAIAARAALQVSRSARHVGQEAVQLHGGIGVTAEYPVGHYFAGLTAFDALLGTPGDQLRMLVDGIGDYGVVALHT